MDKIVAVLGATGQTGEHIVQKLLEQNIQIRILSRNLAKPIKMFGNRVEIIEGDLLEVKDLKSLVTGVSYLFAAHGADTDSDERGYELVDYGGMDKALDSFPANQHTHIIYISSISVEPHFSAIEPLSRFYWKKMTEWMIQESGHPYTIVRPGWLNNNQGGNLQIVAEQGDLGSGKISREDVAEVMVKAMNVDSAMGKTFEVYNVSVIPENNWENFFAELVSDETNN
jgi:uncharacterized protein YbjT (DUF2867 family)